MFDQALLRIAQLEFDVIWFKNQLGVCSSQFTLFAVDKKGEKNEEMNKEGNTGEDAKKRMDREMNEMVDLLQKTVKGEKA